MKGQSLKIEVYNNDLSYKRIINPLDIIGDIRFSANINASMGPITIKIKDNFASQGYENGNIVKVFVIDEFSPGGRLTYGGVINRIRRVSTATIESIELDCLGYSQLMLFSSIETLNTINRPPQDIVSDIISYMNTLYPGYFYIKSIGTGSNISYSIQRYSTALQHLQAVIDATGWNWYIGPDGGLLIGPKPTTPTHVLNYRKHIQEINMEEDATNIVNRVYVERSTKAATSQPGPAFEQFVAIIENTASIAQYGVRAKFFPGSIRAEGNPLIAIFYGPIGLAAAQAFGQSKLILEPQKATTVKVNNNYDFNTIQPFETISIQNINYEIENLQVLKVSYNKDGATLELENLENLGTLGKKLLG